MLDLHRLRLLQEFAARGSIARTAAALGYTPSAVSQQLAALEREAGTALLDRSARRAELTDAGRRLAGHAERILAMVEEAETDLSAEAQEPAGRVVATAFPSAAVAFAPSLARSLRAHPRLTLVLRQTPAREGLRQVRSGDVDVAIVDDWTSRLAEEIELGGSILTCYHLIRDRLVLVLPRTHPAAAADQPVDLRALRHEPWLAAPAGEPSRQAVDRLLAAVGVTPPVLSEFEGMATIVSLVARGIGSAHRGRAPAAAAPDRAPGRHPDRGQDHARAPGAGDPGRARRHRAGRGQPAVPPRGPPAVRLRDLGHEGGGGGAAQAGRRPDLAAPGRHLRLLRLRGGRSRPQRAAAAERQQPGAPGRRLRRTDGAEFGPGRGRVPGHAAGRDHGCGPAGAHRTFL